MTQEARSFEDAYRQFTQVRIKHDALIDLKAEIEQVMRLAPYRDNPPCLPITGPAGVGKSWLFEWLEEAYRGGDRIEVQLPRRPPVLVKKREFIWLTFSQNPTLKDLAESVLILYGDPHPHQGDVAEKTHRIDHFIQLCGTKAWFLDECQYLVDREGVVVMENIINWLRDRSSRTARKKLDHGDATGIALFMFGLGRIDYALLQDPQVERRFQTSLRLEPFATQGASWDQFRSVVLALADHLPIPLAADIMIDEERAGSQNDIESIDLNFRRFHYATWGIIGRLSVFLQNAVRLADRRRLQSIDLALLAEAFSREVNTSKNKFVLLNPAATAAPFENMQNPFLPSFDRYLPPPPLPDDRDLLPIAQKRRKTKKENRAQLAQAFKRA